jgi:hypothetical protein
MSGRGRRRGENSFWISDFGFWIEEVGRIATETASRQWLSSPIQNPKSKIALATP